MKDRSDPKQLTSTGQDREVHLQDRTGKYKCRTEQGRTSTGQEREVQIHDRTGKDKYRT